MPSIAFLTLSAFCLLESRWSSQKNNFQRGKALSSSFQFGPFADQFWLSALHKRIYKVLWKYFCRFFFVCLLYNTKLHEQKVKFNDLKLFNKQLFELYFFSLIEPIWAPDKQAKMVFLKNSFSRSYSNFSNFLKYRNILSGSRDIQKEENK